MASKEEPTKSGSVPETGSNSSRKDRRKNYWVNRIKNKDIAAISAETDKNESDLLDASPRKKLRNRESIAKPDSLKYEPNLSRGFHSKILENLHVDTRKRKKGRSEQQQQPVHTNTNTSTFSPPKSKNKSLPQQHDQTVKTTAKPQQATPIVAPTEESETFDSYAFSLGLINGQIDTTPKEKTKDSKKYVLFVGNLPFDVTKEQLEEHFRKTGGIKAVRIPKAKGTGSSRGFAYMEFDGRISHGIALRLHQTTLGGRKINVEFTSIGGGNSEKRKEKLKQKNHKRKNMKMNF